ncbi:MULTISPECIES: hypothetical protein [unclassified Mesorhizobium]
MRTNGDALSLARLLRAGELTAVWVAVKQSAISFAPPAAAETPQLHCQQ